MSGRRLLAKHFGAPPTKVAKEGEEDPVHLLELEGYVVLPCLDARAREEARAGLRAIVAESVEFKQGAREWVMGGFQAMAHATSFHNDTVRKIRQWAMFACVDKLWGAYVRRYGTPADNLEQIMDRVMIRPAGRVATAESWHRDVTPFGDPKRDKTFGGWINLDETNQTFSCVPRTHKEDPGDGVGFATFKKNDPRIERFHRDKTLTQIPPGHILVFFEHLVHEVVSTRAPRDVHRLFLGWRLTRQVTPLLESGPAPGGQPLARVVREFAVPHLKSGQVPPMYALLHWSNWRKRLEDFSRHNIDPHLLVDKTVKRSSVSGEQGQVYRITPRFMPSGNELIQRGLLFDQPKYTENEIQMHLPGRGPWRVLAPGTQQAATVRL